jgi:hypothetical protein
VGEFPDPVRESKVFLCQVRRILAHILLMMLFGDISLIKDDLAVTTMAKGSEHTGYHFKGNGLHLFLPRLGYEIE